LATDREFTRFWIGPGYRVYQHEIDEKAKTLKLWIRRKRGNRRLECSGCGRKFTQIYDTGERAVRDLPWSGFTATAFVEVYRMHCPDCGGKREKVPLLPGKAPFSKRFEDAVGLACEMASARQVARQFGLAASTVRAIDLRYLERWNASRRTPALRQMGVDEIYLGKKQKFLSVVSNLETGEPLWFGRERKKESLDGFFRTEPSARQRRGIEAACVDMGNPYRLSSEQGRPTARSSMTSFISCSTPMPPWMKCGGRSFSAKADRCAAWSRGSAAYG
jgi:transposase